jgi:hypothetical protein
MENRSTNRHSKYLHDKHGLTTASPKTKNIKKLSIKLLNRKESIKKKSIIEAFPKISSIDDKSNFLEYAYDKINQKDLSNLKEMITNYAKKFKNLDDKALNDILKVKVEPSNLMNMIEELKHRIDLFNIHDIYKINYFHIGKLEAALPTLNKIK